ncbi:MAG: oxygen-independent coproporphyrinogen III oxidase-like protein [Neisseriaceae bacterium]|nr:oxygen-independent coproporphyrinogen III oxidase-like protein [Neisseriaceae bacterium]
MSEIAFMSGQLTTLPPLSLYVHIPWCVKKCPYCDFNSHTAGAELPEEEYCAALIKDLELELPNVWGRPIESIFIGGGTPSLFSAKAMNGLISDIRARLPLKPNLEITMEANPGTFEIEKFLGFKEAGVTRLSIGVQSFHNDHLNALGRIHQAQEAIDAITLATTAFERVNVDLMYALPQQTVAQAVADVQTAIDLGVSHISAYHLTLEPNTAFGHTPPRGIPADELALDIEEAVHATLAAAGFEHYETSAFAKHQHYAQHNLNYWRFGDYIGIGAGAHGKISYPSHVERTTRRRHPNDYLLNSLSNGQVASRTPVAKADLPFEFMMNALRLHQGVPSGYFQERTGLSLSVISPILEQAQKQGLLAEDPTKLAPTLMGQRFLNNLLQLFLQE